MQTWEQDLNDSLDKYNTLLAKLEPYPEWHAKVVEEVGHWFHMIHNNLSESDTKRNIFLKMVSMHPFRTDRNTSYDRYANNIIHNLIYMYLLSLKPSLTFSDKESQMT